MSNLIESIQPSQLVTGYDKDYGLPSIPFLDNSNTVVVGRPMTSRLSNPSYKVQIARQQEAGTSYLREIMEASTAPFSVMTTSRRSDYKDNLAFRTGSTFGNLSYLDFTAQDDAAIADIALKRLKNKLANNLGQYQALAPLAELREFRGLISTSAHLTTDLVKTLILAKQKPRDAFKYASEAWLNWSFGISPMLSDAASAAEAIAAFQTRNDRKLVVSGSATRQWTTSFDRSWPMGYAQLNNRVRMEHSLTYRYKAAYSVAFNTANNYEALSHFGFEITALPSLAWELTAFSWIADYFGTVGDFLSDAFTSPPGNTIYVSSSRLYQNSYTGNLTYQPVWNGMFWTTAGGSAGKPTGRFVSYKRDPLGALPHRALRFKTVDEIGINSVKRLMNLSSLLVK